jgi:hypothetical protein
MPEFVIQYKLFGDDPDVVNAWTLLSKEEKLDVLEIDPETFLKYDVQFWFNSMCDTMSLESFLIFGL